MEIGSPSHAQNGIDLGEAAEERLMRYTALVVLLCALTASAAEPRGRLCVGNEPCQQVACGENVASAEQPRAYFFYEPGVGYRLGVLAAHERTINCAGKDLLTLSLNQQPEKLELRVTRKEDGTFWRVPLTAKDVERPVPIHIVQGTYDIAIEEPHFVPFAKQVTIGAQAENVRVALTPLPRLTGGVFDRVSMRPLVRAVVKTESGCEALSDDKGRFTLEVDPAKWPKSITISEIGYGDRTVAVPPAKADTEFDEIYLSDSATILVDLQQQRPGQVEQLELEKLREHGRAPGPTVKTIKVGKEAHFRFDGVEPGQYVVIAGGASPWERFGKRVDVGEHDEISAPMQIAPFDVRLRLPADHGRVILRNLDAFWEAPIPLHEREATVDLWQGGRVAATVDSAGLTPFIVKRSLPEGTAFEWTLDPPPHEVVGTVTDSKTGAAIAGAAVSLRIKAADGYSLTVSTLASSDGSFHFAPVAPGLHTIAAVAKGYPRDEKSYEFADTEQTHDVTLQLTATPLTRITVTDSRGTPIAGARVFDPRRGGNVAGVTDANGTARVFIPESESREFFVVPLDGSLGSVRLTSGTADASLQIGAGSARIVLRTETETHEPLMGVTVEVRYNGTTLPDEVMEAFSGRGSKTLSDAQGRIVLEHMPAGVYEFWPVASPTDLRGFQSGRPAALRMQVNPGENLTVMTFAAQR
jgi:hypothetical protein